MFLRSFLRRKHILDIVSQKHISCDLCTSFACAKGRRPLGGSWKLLELISVSRFLAYVILMIMCGIRLGFPCVIILLR